MNSVLIELIKWLEGERYIIPSERMTSVEERAFLYQTSRNRMIDKTISKIKELEGGEV